MGKYVDKAPIDDTANAKDRALVVECECTKSSHTES